MIQIDTLSYSFPEKDLYHKISCTIGEGEHIALIGSNGTGKTTLIDMIMNTDEYLYTGWIRKRENLKIGYVSQYVAHEKDHDCTVYEYLCQDFLKMLKEQEDICVEMETATDFDEIMERYQKSLDDFAAVDGDNYETNVKKQLKLAGLTSISEVVVADISGGEYKLIQIIRQMMRFPGILIMDEPDVFLDFDNLFGLRNLIASYPGTILVITHNRYLLNHCFNKILHLENADIQEFEGSYMDYQVALLSKKIEMQEQSAKDLEEIERQRKVVERIRNEATYIDNSAKGRQLKARKSLLERLEAKAIKAPFVEVREPEIQLYKELLAESQDQAAEGQTEENIMAAGQEAPAISVKDYQVAFDDILLENVSFEIGPKDKVALVGPNGTGKTTLLKDIYKSLEGKKNVGYLSQIYSDIFSEKETVFTAFDKVGLETRREVNALLKSYCFTEEMADQLVDALSGGERNLLQLALMSQCDYDILLLDEPTSHLDTYAQIALEQAIRQYPGAVLMVSHDFYTIVNCVDYVLMVEDKTIRKMSNRAFRKMIYKEHFSSEYLELDKQKKELEQQIQLLLRNNDYEKAKTVCEKLDETVLKMNKILG